MPTPMYQPDPPPPELRYDPVTDAWVLVAPRRALRPGPDGGHDGPCPFCPGNEAETPPETWAIRSSGTAPDTPGWRVRVVPNRYPAVVPAGEGAAAPASRRLSGGVRDTVTPAVGIHEVVIETPGHDDRLVGRSRIAVRELLGAWRNRVRAALGVPGIRHVVLFKNVGIRAGASLPHPHSQVVGVPVVPPAVAARVRAADDHSRRLGRSLFAVAIDDALDRGDLLVAESGRFAVITPFASRTPWELRVIPRRAGADFRGAADDALDDLADLLAATIAALGKAVPDVQYNLVIQSAPAEPARDDAFDGFRWHVEILPRLARFAGLEWGTGLAINHLPPETCAARLRALL